MQKKLKFIFLILFLILLSLTSYYLIRFWQLGKASRNVLNTQADKNSKDDWINYSNSLGGFNMKIPPSLVERDFGEGSLYYNFVRFEEALNSDDKGIAVGIRQTNLESEINRIKADFVKDPNAVLIEQNQITVDGATGIQLYYKPKIKEDGEERMIAIFGKGNYVYSVSTVPKQIDKVLDNFKFSN